VNKIGQKRITRNFKLAESWELVMNNRPERRDFDRFAIEFVLDVDAKDAEGKIFNEKTVLKNISGGGACFVTRQAGRYFLGQLLDMTIFLPGTSEVNAFMKGKGNVVRIDQFNNSGTGEKNRKISIAVKFDTLLNFERSDI
jgi:hypothetical protein